MSFKRDQYLTLEATAVSDSYDHPHLSRFTTYFPENFTYEGELEIGVSEIFYTNSFHNLPDTPINFVVVYDSEDSSVSGSKEVRVKAQASKISKDLASLSAPGLGEAKYIETKDTKHILYLVQGMDATTKLPLHQNSCHFTDGHSLVKHTNYILTKTPNTKTNHYPQLYFNSTTNKVSLVPGDTLNNGKIYCIFSEEFNAKLGFSFYNVHDYSSILKKNKIAGTKEIDMTEGFKYMTLCSDFVTDSIVNGCYIPVLRTISIPSNVPFADTVHLEYNTINYMKVRPRRFNSITVWFENSNRELMKLRFGQVNITLHVRFRK